MRSHGIIRLFVDTNIKKGVLINLDKEQSHYLTNVMRRKVGDYVNIFNGVGDEFKSKITEAGKNRCVLQPIEKSKDFFSSPDVSLYYSPVKNIKNEYLVQKATELGVAKIVPVAFNNTIKRKINIERCKAVAIEAAEQCERMDIPEISEIISIDKLISEAQNKNIMLCDESGQGRPVEEIQPEQNNNSWAIIIGAEGGFTKQELEQFYQLKNLYGIGLGPRILKAETAVISALTTWQIKFGDFNKSPDFRK